MVIGTGNIGTSIQDEAARNNEPRKTAATLTASGRPARRNGTKVVEVMAGAFIGPLRVNYGSRRRLLPACRAYFTAAWCNATKERDKRIAMSDP